MSSYEAIKKTSKNFEKQFTEAEEKIGETTRQVQNEWAKAFEEMSRTVMARASAEMQSGLKLSTKLTACRSPSDAVLAYQEWLTEEMNAHSEDARNFMANCQKFFTESAKLLANGQNAWMSQIVTHELTRLFEPSACRRRQPGHAGREPVRSRQVLAPAIRQ